VIRRAEVAHEIGLGPIGDLVEDVHLEPALARKQCCKEPDRAGPRDEHARRPPHGAGGNPVDVLPGLGDDARRLDKDAREAERTIDWNGEAGIDPEELGAEPVQSLDPVLGVLAVAAHVPLARGAARAGHRVGMPHDAGDVLPRRQPAALRRFDDFSERLVSQDQPVGARRCGAVFPVHDLDVGAADAHGERAHEH
jgi:hypothetical protein